MQKHYFYIFKNCKAISDWFSSKSFEKENKGETKISKLLFL